MSRGRRHGIVAAPARPRPSAGGPVAEVAESVAARLARVEAEVDAEILSAFLEAAGIGSEDELAARLSRPHDASLSPEELLEMTSLAAAHPALRRHLPQLLAAAASACAAHSARFAEMAERPRTRQDQELMARIGINWRNEDEVANHARVSRTRATELERAAAGALDVADVSQLVLTRARSIRDSKFGGRARRFDALAGPIHDALATEDLEHARRLHAASLAALGNEDDAEDVLAADESCLVIASRMVRACREVGKEPVFNWLQGLSHLGQGDLDRLGIDRLAGEAAERILMPPQPRDLHMLAKVSSVAAFEEQARRILRHPDRYHRSHAASRAGGDQLRQTIQVPVYDAASFRALADHYAGHPAFAGYGLLTSVKVGGGGGKSDLAVGLRLAYVDEQDERREIWAVLDRGASGARSERGRTRACRLEELGLSPEDLTSTYHWSRAPRDAYDRSIPGGRRIAEVEPARMRTAEVLASPEPACDHASGVWRPTRDGDALRFSCPGCERLSLAVVPRHQVPGRAGGLPELEPLDERRYLARQRFHAILEGRSETATSFAELRERDGVLAIGSRPVISRPPGSRRARDMAGAFAGRG